MCSAERVLDLTIEKPLSVKALTVIRMTYISTQRTSSRTVDQFAVFYLLK